MVTPAETYQLLRNITSPVVAITSARGETRNGMIIDSAIRASIVPSVPRIAIFIHKFNFTHDLVFDSGCFVLHLLRTDQFSLIHHLGFQSGRAVNKLATVAYRLGETGAPVFDDCFAHFECRVVNALDTGSSTGFLGDVVAVGYGAATAARGEVMTAAYFRAHIPREWKADYEAQLGWAQREAERTARDIRPLVWKGLGRREPGAVD